MKLKEIWQEFCICKLEDISQVDFSDEFCFLGKTDEELSLVCQSSKVPSNIIVGEYGWRAFRIEGELEFSLVGILSQISNILSDSKIGIFAVSTYNTDYILIKEENFEAAKQALTKNGYIFE